LIDATAISEQQVPSFATLALPHNSIKIVDYVKIGFLLAAVSSDSKLLSQYSVTQQMHIATGNPNTRVTYKNYIQHLQDYSSLEDKAHPMRQRRHAHSARLEQEEASTYYDTSSEIMDLLAHKSVSTDVIDDVRHIFA
jgi:hypothetical protein